MNKRATVAIVPAEPGFSLATLMVVDPGEKARFSFAPIIAWQVETYKDEEGDFSGAVSHPIVAAFNTHRNDFRCSIRRPDGHFVFSEGTTIDNEPDAIEYAEELVRENYRELAESEADLTEQHGTVQ
jgi:hypothetical protein